MGTGMHFASKLECAVADADLQIGEGGGGSSRPWDNVGPGLQNNFFRPFGPQFGLKIRGGGCDPPVPLPWIRHWCGQLKGVGLGEEPGPFWPCFIFSGNCANPFPAPHPLWADRTLLSPLYSSAFKIKEGGNCALFKTASFLVARD